MFRRPMSGGVFGRARPGAALAAANAQVQQMIANGRAAQAAEMLTQMCAQAEANRRPRLAANLHAQAARVFVLSKDERSASKHARLALDQFIALNMTPRAARFYANLVREMNEGGMASAHALESEYSGRLGSFIRAAGQPAARGRLPAKCPNCGAPAKSDQVDWIDSQSAECAFCGGVIQTE
ncbi:MAG: zinc ribbon domain-containing protein [Chloroflexi bacterium]|nr:zinc ribbon domain-containing protein [Chloroflexota bacterium]